jgi:hypothetical protein
LSTRPTRKRLSNLTTNARTTLTTRNGTVTRTSKQAGVRLSDSSIFRIHNRGTILSGCIQSMSRTLS